MKHDSLIETPDMSVAKYVHEHNGNPVYFDGATFWIVIDGMILIWKIFFQENN